MTDGWALKNEWRRDIRECDGCHTEQYALPRYQIRTGIFRGFFCDRCWAQELQAIVEHAGEVLRDALLDAKIEYALERRKGIRDD